MDSLITSLSLANNRLGSRAVSAFADALYFLPSLTTLDLSGNPFGEAGARAIAEALTTSASTMATVAIDGAPLPIRELRGTKAVRTLRLERMELGPLSAVVIATLVQANASLTSLSVAENRLGAAGAVAVTRALRFSKVTTLDLSSNELTGDSAQDIASQLEASHSSLTSINVDGFALPIKKLRGIVGEEAKPVDAINLQKKKIGTLSGVLIGNMVRTNPTLTSLNLSGNSIGGVGLRPNPMSR